MSDTENTSPRSDATVEASQLTSNNENAVLAGQTMPGIIYHSNYGEVTLSISALVKALIEASVKLTGDAKTGEFIATKIPEGCGAAESIRRAMSKANSALPKDVEFKDLAVDSAGDRVIVALPIGKDADKREVLAGKTGGMALVDNKNAMVVHVADQSYAAGFKLLEDTYNATLNAIVSPKIWATMERAVTFRKDRKGAYEAMYVGHGLIYTTGQSAMRGAIVSEALVIAKSPYRIHPMDWRPRQNDPHYDDAALEFETNVTKTIKEYEAILDMAVATGKPDYESAGRAMEKMLDNIAAHKLAAMVYGRKHQQALERAEKLIALAKKSIGVPPGTKSVIDF